MTKYPYNLQNDKKYSQNLQMTKIPQNNHKTTKMTLIPLDTPK
jgi:hypothetical protein